MNLEAGEETGTAEGLPSPVATRGTLWVAGLGGESRPVTLTFTFHLHPRLHSGFVSGGLPTNSHHAMSFELFTTERITPGSKYIPVPCSASIN